MGFLKRYSKVLIPEIQKYIFMKNLVNNELEKVKCC